MKNHPWFKLNYPVYVREGLIVGYNRIPVQEEILNTMKSQGFDSGYIERWLDANKHNHTTTTYYLNHKKMKLRNKLEIMLDPKNERNADKDKQRLLQDPESNIIEEFLVDDIR